MTTSSQVHPVAVEHFHFPRFLFQDIPFIAAIDKGCSLVKILYEDKNCIIDDCVSVICETYLNENFSRAIDHFLEQAYYPNQTEAFVTLHVTGAGCEKDVHILHEKIQSTKIKIKFVDEFFSQAKGAHFLIENANENELFHQEKITSDEFAEYFPENGFYNNFKISLSAVVEERREKYRNKLPASVTFMGSGTGLLQILENGSAKFSGTFMLSGKSFLGLAQLLLGTADYKEIMTLAESGDCCKVDTLIGDVFLTTKDSVYGNDAGHESFFSFGKIAEEKKPLNAYKREDLADSLVKMYAEASATAAFNGARASGFVRLYIAGNLARGRLFRVYFLRQIMKEMLMCTDPLEVRFLKTGHTGAFGALQATNSNNKIF